MPTTEPVPTAKGYIRKPNGVMYPITGVPGPPGEQGDQGAHGADYPILLNDTAPATRIDGTTLVPGDMWLDTSVVPMGEAQITFNGWGATATSTGTGGWIQATACPFVSFRAPTSGLVQLFGWVGIDLVSAGNAGANIWFQLNESAGAPESYSGTSGYTYAAGDTHQLPLAHTRSLAAGDKYDFCPAVLWSAVTGNMTGACIILVFLPDGTYKAI